MSLARGAAETFIAEYGHSPRAVWSAPGRVNLIGEHTDYNDGFVLPFALPHRTAVAISPRSDDAFSLVTLGHDRAVQRARPLRMGALTAGTVRGWSAYPAGVAWALSDAGFQLPGANVAISGNVPTGAGLSSSHALQCAVALALLDNAGKPLDEPGSPSRAEIARWVQRSENEFVGAPTGLLDQTASLSCTRDHALFFDVRSGAQEQIPFDTSGHGLELLVIDTRANHSHQDSGYRERREGCERAAELLGISALRDLGIDELDQRLPHLPAHLRPLVRHIVTENDRVITTVDALRNDAVLDIGPLLTASHVSLRDDFRISCTELDLAVDSSKAAGAIGARMTGGGFGGSAIALVRSSERERIERSVSRAFADQNLPTPRLFTAVPAAGAGRDN